MSISWALAVPVIVFLVVVAPVWLTLHYKNQRTRLEQTSLGPDQVAVDRSELIRLQRAAVKLDERLAALERVLDDEFPNWRRT